MVSKLDNWTLALELKLFNASIDIICDADSVFSADTDVLTLAEVDSKFENLVKELPLNDSNEEILWLWVANVSATEELKSPVTDATDADNAVKLALLAENEVATEELNSPVTDETDEDNAVILALLAENDVATDALNGWMLPSKLITSFPPLPNRYKVELPLA